MEQAARTLTPNRKAHLYLKKMRFRDYQESLILAPAFGENNVEDLRKAALSTFPTLAGRDQNDSFYSRTGKGGGRGHKKPYGGKGRGN